jgi:transposase
MRIESILSGEEVFVGLEDSKKTWKLCVRSGGVIVHETAMPAEYEGIHNYFKNRFPRCRLKVIYEAGFSGFNLHDQLEADGWECVVTPPHTVTQEKVQLKKNDRTDCRRLARNLENGDYHVCFVPDRELREDRQLSRVCQQLDADVKRTCNRIRRGLEFHGLDREFPAGPWSQAMYARARKYIEESQTSDSLRFSFDILFRELEQLRRMKAEVVLRLRKLARSGRYKESVALLKSAPGVGELTAVRLALEWGDLSRFKRKEDFASFLGLVPSDHSSGEQEHQGHITKQGNRSVRSWLVESSWRALRTDPVLLAKFKRVLASCGSKKKAIVAVARKLALRLRKVLLTGEPYAIGVVE